MTELPTELSLAEQDALDQRRMFIKVDDEPTEQLTPKTSGLLFELRVRGMLAMMFAARGAEPTEDDMRFLTGRKTITARNIGEIAGRLDYSVDLSFYRHEPQQQGEPK